MARPPICHSLGALDAPGDRDAPLPFAAFDDLGATVTTYSVPPSSDASYSVPGTGYPARARCPSSFT